MFKPYIWAIALTLLIVGLVDAYGETPREVLEKAQQEKQDGYGAMLGYVLRVKDGDTYEILVTPFPSQYIAISLRLRGVDTPEIGNAMCTRERALGVEAKRFVQRSLNEENRIVALYNLTDSGGFGRYASSVDLDGRDLATMLQDRSLARSAENAQWQDGYWCDEQ